MIMWRGVLETDKGEPMRIPYGKGIEIYGNSPPSLQKFLGFFLTPLPRSAILGSGFYAHLKELRRTQWYEPEKLRKYQESRLKALIRHAYQNVPYYRRLFKERNIVVDDIKTTEDLEKIPILTKEDLRNHFEDLIAVNAKEYKYGTASTSGSTGKPVTFYLDQQNREVEYAAKWRQREWANVNLTDRIASFRPFRGMRGIDFKSGKPAWKFNALSKELEFNIFGLNKETLGKHVEKLRKFNPKLIEGFPSTIELLAKYIIDQKIHGISPLAVQTSSESLSTRRAVIEDAFQCNILDWYGQSEYVVSAGECPEGNYHITESGIMEFIRDGKQVSNGEIGELVGTRLYNYSMPLIRYRTTDIGSYSDEKCNCGRGLQLLRSLEGRVSDSILATDGRIVTGPSFEHYWKNVISPYAKHLDYVHIIQRSDKSILIKMVKEEGYSDEETAAIWRGLVLLLGPKIQIEFEELDSVPIERKWRFTESELHVCLI